MRKVLRLAYASLKQHPIRVVLTTLATMASTCLVVWIGGGYDALIASFDEYANLSLGRYELSVAPVGAADELVVPDAVLNDLRGDPTVAAVEAMWLTSAPLRAAPDGAGPDVARMRADDEYGRAPTAALLATDSPVPLFDVLRGDWLGDEDSDAVAVLREDAAERWNLEVGDTLYLGESTDPVALEIVGVVDAPVALANAMTRLRKKVFNPGLGEVFVTPRTAERITGRSVERTFLGVSLEPDTDLTRFRFGWAPRLGHYETPVQFQQSVDIEEALDESSVASNFRLLALATTGISMLVAFLVILCTLSTGVNERIRQFAVLRSIGFTRSNIAQLVVVESVMLAGIGFVAGLAFGQILLWATAWAAAPFLEDGLFIGPTAMLMAVLATFGGGGLAAVIPGWRATSIRPVDAMASQTAVAGRGRVWIVRLAVAGVVLIAVGPALVFVFPPRSEFGAFVAMAIAFPCLAIGFVLVTPAFVSLVDRWGGPLLARLLGIDRKLLASQITSHLWRTVGSAVSLAVGMGLYVSVHVWGTTMLQVFIPGDWSPDAILSFQPDGLPPEWAKEIGGIDGVDPELCLPIVVEQPRLLHDLTNSAERASITRQDNVVVVGVDASRGFGGDDPLFSFEWTAGSPEEAAPLLASGRGCVVPDHFLVDTGLGLGDSFELVPPENPSEVVEYTVAGAVRMTGWHWQTKATGFRSRTHRAAALVFADYATVANDFDLPAASYVWLSYDSPSANPAAIENVARATYASLLGGDVADDEAPAENAPSVKIVTVKQVRAMIRGAAAGWLWMLSTIPILSVGITGIGVVNVLLASVRSRRWEMGVMRSIGVTRWAIVKAILAEGLLIGAVACLLSLGFGVMAGWCGAGIAQHVSFFGGFAPTLVVPWPPLVVGMVLFLGLSTLTALWPAVEIGRTRPYVLLQQGRTTF